MSSLSPSPCLEHVIDYTIFGGKSWQDKMDICNECKCCEPHNINKPRYVLPSVCDFDCIDVLDTTTEVWRLGLCRCKCRYLARRMCEKDNYEIMCASPDPCDLPLPPQEWLKQDSMLGGFITPTYITNLMLKFIDPPYQDDDLSILDRATDEALDHYWKGQVKACQYAIFHMC